jgi:hypothetical protein
MTRRNGVVGNGQSKDGTGTDRTSQDWFFGMSETADDHFTYLTGQGNNGQLNEPLTL